MNVALGSFVCIRSGSNHRPGPDTVHTPAGSGVFARWAGAGLRLRSQAGLLPCISSGAALALAPMAYVSALRETSTMFAVVIGVVFLKEHLDLRRLAAVFCAMAGSLLLKISR